MNKTFFGQNIYRISGHAYNFNVTVKYPWSLFEETVSFDLMQGDTKIATTQHTLVTNMENIIPNMFPDIKLTIGHYRIVINRIGYSGSANFSINDNTENVDLILNIEEIYYHNPIGIAINMDGISNVKTNNIKIQSTDAKSTSTLDLMWGDDGNEKRHQWIPDYSAAFIKGGYVENTNFSMEVTLDEISVNQWAKLFITNNRPEERIDLQEQDPLTFTLNENDYEGVVSWKEFFQDANALVLNVQINESYSL